MVERIDDWHQRMSVVGPGEFKLSYHEPYKPGKQCRVIERNLSISDVSDLLDKAVQAMQYLARTFR